MGRLRYCHWLARVWRPPEWRRLLGKRPKDISVEAIKHSCGVDIFFLVLEVVYLIH